VTVGDKLPIGVLRGRSLPSRAVRPTVVTFATCSLAALRHDSTVLAPVVTKATHVAR
jgi:hypothetical protein